MEATRLRLEKGKKEYGDSSFTRPSHELAEEMEEEIMDVCGWAFILWLRIRRMKETLPNKLKPRRRKLREKGKKGEKNEFYAIFSGNLQARLFMILDNLPTYYSQLYLTVHIKSIGFKDNSYFLNFFGCGPFHEHVQS